MSIVSECLLHIQRNYVEPQNIAAKGCKGAKSAKNTSFAVANLGVWSPEPLYRIVSNVYVKAASKYE